MLVVKAMQLPLLWKILQTIGGENLEDTRLSRYQNAIAAKIDFSNPAKVGEVQAVVMNINNTCSYKLNYFTRFL